MSYSKYLAEAILRVLHEAYPDAMDLAQIKLRLPEYSTKEDGDWFKSVRALQHQGSLKRQPDTGDQSDAVVDWTRLEINPQDLLARRFANALKNPHFQVETGEPYLNDYGVPGWRYSGRVGGRTFYISESRASRPSSPKKIAGIILDPGNLDRQKTILYRNRNCKEGLRIEARCREDWFKRWFEVWTPKLAGQLSTDFFAVLASQYAET